MSHALTRAQVRDLDRRAIEEFGIPSIILMENAGRGAAELLLSLGVHGRVVVCCGKGNNGGDGFVIARRLHLHQVPFSVLLFASPEELTGDALINFRIVERLGLACTVLPDAAILRQELATAEWTVDALFGTGLTSAVRPPFDGVIAAINSSPTRVLAVDVPSGLDCDTGEPLGPTVRAHHTATLAALKVGFAAAAARPYLGQVHLIDIGVTMPSPNSLVPTLPRGNARSDALRHGE